MKLGKTIQNNTPHQPKNISNFKMAAIFDVLCQILLKFASQKCFTRVPSEMLGFLY